MTDRKFELIEHTADTGLIAWGDTLAGAFANAACGLCAIITGGTEAVRETECRTLELNEADTEALLFEWLNSLIYFFDAEMLLFSRFDIIEFDGLHLKAECYGEPYDPSRHRLKTGVKAATYHMLEVDGGRNRVRVIFDV